MRHCVSVILGLIAFIQLAAANVQLQRSVTGGIVEGMVDPYYTTTPVYTWKGIPFAAPPVGNLRFASPAPVNNWTGVLKTQAFSPGCIATCSLPRPSLTCTPTTSEDCLYLNVFTPTNATQAQLPVLFFIHGGGYLTGSAGVPLYEAASLAATQGIVVVTANYRLGMFGALYTGTVLGNFQIQDQRAVMIWIQENIVQFGGNPEFVTISGQSAGAMSCGVHMTSPPSAGLFSGVIMASNPLGLPFQNPDLATRLGKKVLDALGCPHGGAAELQCLRSKTATELLVVSNDTRNFPWPDHALMAMLPWVPVTGTPDLPMQPLEAAASGNFTIVPLVIGSLSNDSVPFVQGLAAKPLKNWELDALMGYVFGIENTIEIKKLYGPPSNDDDTREYLSKIVTDYMFFCPTRNALRGWTAAASKAGYATYQYVFSHLPSMSSWVWNTDSSMCDVNVCHSDDLPFVFNSWLADPEVPQPTAAEQNLITFMQSWWGNFTVDQNLANLPNNLWPTFATTDDAQLNILASGPVLVEGYDEKYCKFFDTIGYNRE